jgi:hypothetical protein
VKKFAEWNYATNIDEIPKYIKENINTSMGNILEKGEFFSGSWRKGFFSKNQYVIVTSQAVIYDNGKMSGIIDKEKIKSKGKKANGMGIRFNDDIWCKIIYDIRHKNANIVIGNGTT